MAEQNFDLVVLGGGSAGYAAAIRARQLGSSVVIIEEDKLGGTCLHRGCIPTKALVHAAEVAETAKNGAKYGIMTRVTGVDMPAVNAYKDGIVGGKFKGLQGLIKAKGITTVSGRGYLHSANTVRVGEDAYVGRNVVLATGSAPKALDDLSIGGRVITSDVALQLPYVPSQVLVLGGGVIGVEFASLWKGLGAEVTIIEGLDHLVPKEDQSLSKQLERNFKRRGIGFVLGQKLAEVSQNDQGVLAKLGDGRQLSGDVLLVAVGRSPVTAGIGLAEVGVNLDRGFVVTDERLRTSVPGVWAIGDIVPGVQLAHRSYQQGIFVAEEMAGLNPRIIEDVNVPKITYSDPEIASIGLSEAGAKEKYGAEEIAAYEYNLVGNAKSSILGTTGFVKVVRIKGGAVVGVHMIGSRVSELIGEAQLIVNWEAWPEDIAPLIHAHPTQTESLGEAMLALAGKPLHAV